MTVGGVVRQPEVAAEDKSHVLRHIVRLEETVHLRQPRVLQAVGGPEDGVGVGGAFEGVLLNLLGGGGEEVVGVHILFFVDGLEFALKETEDGVEEASGIELAPLP